MNALMALGPHVFEVLPLNYQELERTTEAIWASVPRLGARPARQFVGYGDDILRISGVLFPEALGGRSAFEAIRATQAAADPVALVGFGTASVGRVWGRVIILSVHDRQESIGGNGAGEILNYEIDVAPYGDGPGASLFGLF
ncbi:phage tail protein [Kaistia sp. MMO-174]|uniref:phage tail protein n=1 Tax=Kaistia sp. MMO-174 TaxID=3081256 RepID=UPI003016CD0D